HAHELRELHVGVAAEICELDRPALRLRQAFESFADGPMFDVLLGGERRVIVTRLGFGHLERRRPEGRLATEDINGTVVDDRQEPGTWVAALAAVAPRSPPGRQERILDDVLRGLALPEDPVGQRVRQTPVAVVKRGEGAQIPGGKRRQEGVIGRLLIRHYEKMYGRRTGADVGRRSRKRKRPERPASVPCRSFKALRPGRGADPRYPLGPPLMLSPVALPGNDALDGISDPFPLADPSGQEEIYGVISCQAINLSTKSRP